MVKRIRIATEEQLEVNKLLDQEEQAKKSSEYDLLYNDVHNDKVVEASVAEAAAADEEGSDEFGGSSEGEGTNLESETPEEPLEGSEELPKDEAEVAKEELRNLTYNVATEDWESAKERLGQASKFVLSGLKYLAEIGIEYTPIIASKVYKGVVYAFTKLARLSAVGYVTLTRYIARRVSSFNSIKTDIAKLKRTLNIMKSDTKGTDALSGVVYNNKKNINNLKIGSSVDISKNMFALHNFVIKVVNDIDIKIKNDVGAIKHLIGYSGAGTIKSPINLLKVPSLDVDMAKGSMPGYESSSPLITGYVYNKVLPGDVVFIAHLPIEDITELNNMASAYNDSSMFFGLDTKGFKDINSLDYMSVDELIKFLDVLDKLCDVCISHQAIYEGIQKTKHTLRFSFRNYFLKLASSEEKVTLQNSLVEYVYLKSMFIDKVYLAAAMDIHDYTAKVISSGMSFVKDNIQKLS